MVRTWVAAFDRFSADVEDYFEIDDRRVGCTVRYRGTPRDSGLELDARGVDVWEVRDGKIVRGTIGYRDRGTAVAAVSGP